MNDNKRYTQLWIKDFTNEKAKRYDRKWFRRFEKNIKHRQQIKIIKKYLNNSSKWLDAPVGSGRIMSDVKHPRDNCYIFDNSKTFLDFSKRKLNIQESNIFHGDLFNFELYKKFDLITCNNVLFAFENFNSILINLINHLNQDGIIIFDVVNKTIYEELNQSAENQKKSKGWNKSDAIEFCNKYNCEIIEIIPHDYFDNEYILNWKKKGNSFEKKIKTFFWKVLNKLYFNLNLFFLFDFFEKKEKNIKFFNKLIIVATKK